MDDLRNIAINRDIAPELPDSWKINPGGVIRKSKMGKNTRGQVVSNRDEIREKWLSERRKTWDDKKLRQGLFCGGVVVDESEGEVRDWLPQPLYKYTDTFYLALCIQTFIETFFKLSEIVIFPIACVSFTNYYAISEYNKATRPRLMTDWFTHSPLHIFSVIAPPQNIYIK